MFKMFRPTSILPYIKETRRTLGFNHGPINQSHVVFLYSALPQIVTPQIVTLSEIVTLSQIVTLFYPQIGPKMVHFPKLLHFLFENKSVIIWGHVLYNKRTTFLNEQLLIVIKFCHIFLYL